jgi:hypothetical protein
MDRHEKQSVDNRANQLNPHHPAYYLSRGTSPEEAERLVAEARAASARPTAQPPGSGDGPGPLSRRSSH